MKIRYILTLDVKEERDVSRGQEREWWEWWEWSVKGERGGVKMKGLVRWRVGDQPGLELAGPRCVADSATARVSVATVVLKHKTP